MWHEGGAGSIAGDFSADVVVEMTYANYAVYKLTVSASEGVINYGFYNEAGDFDGIARSVTVDGAISLPAFASAWKVLVTGAPTQNLRTSTCMPVKIPVVNWPPFRDAPTLPLRTTMPLPQ